MLLLREEHAASTDKFC